MRSFKGRAERLRDAQLRKGQVVEVIGYRHLRERRARDSSTKLAPEIYAFVVKAR